LDRDRFARLKRGAETGYVICFDRDHLRLRPQRFDGE
jgi:hypothetical protein